MKNTICKVISKIPLKNTLELECIETGRIFYFKLSSCESVQTIEIGAEICIERI